MKKFILKKITKSLFLVALLYGIILFGTHKLNAQSSGGLWYVSGNLLKPVMSTWGISVGTSTITGLTTGDLLPSANNTYDVGSNTASWRNVYASGTLYLGDASYSKDGITKGGAGNLVLTATSGYMALVTGSSGDVVLNPVTGGAGNIAMGIDSTDTITYSAKVASDFTPSTNNTRSLGSSSRAWKNVYASSTLYMGNGSFIDFDSNDVRIAHSLNALTLSGGNLNMSGAVIPVVNNTYNLGSAATGWKDVYVAGNLYTPNIYGNFADNIDIKFGHGYSVERRATAVSTSTSGETIIGVTSTVAPRTITLDTNDVKNGHIFIIKDESGGAGANNITIDTEGAETIDGAASITITVNYGVARLYSNGTNWFTY